MPSSYTSLLGLVLPVQGELQGAWGNTVNNELTALLDTAVSGTTTLSTDADVTLTSTTGAANEARQAILLWTASGTVTRNITAPARSKPYIVINATGGTQSIVVCGVGPTTGVTLLAGEKALVAWNGSDFVKIANFQGDTTIAALTATADSSFTSTGALKISSGTTAERPAGVAGDLRFNTTLLRFEGYDGTNWSGVGGGATGGGPDEIFVENGQTVTTNYAIPSGKNAMSTGPITVNSGVTVTVPTGSRWVVI